MWTRAGLKELAKSNFKRVYKQAVIVCIIVYLIGAVFDGGYNSANNSIQGTVEYNQDQYNDSNDYYYYDEDSNEYYSESGYLDRVDSVINFSSEGVVETFFTSIFNLILKPISAISLTLMIFFTLGVMLIFIVLRAFIYNPIKIGKNNFFMGIRENDRKVGDIFFLFEKSKLISPVITMFFVELYTFLWTLLLFIPGIIKSYEYKMIEYILSENPQIDRKRAFELSKHMMNGQKWDAFVLDLSFIGWNILSSITFGIVGIFYVNPYIESTYAELYAVLRKNAINEGFANKDELPGFDKKEIL